MKDGLRPSLDNVVLSILQIAMALRAGRRCKWGSLLWVRVWWKELRPVLPVTRAEFGPELAQLTVLSDGSFHAVMGLCTTDLHPEITSHCTLKLFRQVTFEY